MMKRVVMYIKDKDDYIEDLLNHIKELTDNNCNFNVDVNIDDKEKHKRFYIESGNNRRSCIRDLKIEDGWT